MGVYSGPGLKRFQSIGERLVQPLSEPGMLDRKQAHL